MAVLNPGVWGIDLGQCGLKALRLQDVGGAVMATAFDYVEHPKILSQPDADPDQLTREALAKFLSRNTLRGDLVAISVPGQSGLARFVKLPPVEEKKIGDIVRFEAKQQIPFNLDEVVWDYQKIGSGMVTDGFALDTEIGLFAIKRDMIARTLQYFKEQNLDVHFIQMAPLALCNFVAFDFLDKGAATEGEEEQTGKKCVVALDTGADSSNLIITDGERIIWQRPIPLGGNHFTRALTKEMKLTFAKAEHLKRNATKSPDLKKILAALKPVLNDFVGEVQRSLGYFTNTHKDAQIEYLVGLGNAFRLPGLQRYLQEKLQLDIRKMTKMERIGGESVLNAPIFGENLATYAVAAGLALQGLKKTRLITNLLPGEIRIERIVRAKKPWAAAAAAALLFGGAAFTYSYYLEDHAYGDDRVKAAIEKSKQVVKKVNDAETKYASAKTAAKKEEAAVHAIIAGQDEQFHWLDLTKFVSEIIPRPDGSNLPPKGEGFWTNKPEELGHPNPTQRMSGRQAFAELKKRREGVKTTGVAGTDPAKDELGLGIDDLIQFNIEAVDCRFCDNLTNYWTAVKEKLDPNIAQSLVRPREQFNKPPEGQGWVVELRGYTYHQKRSEFVQDVLLENIARLGMPSFDASAAVDGKADGKPADGAAKPMGGDAGAKPSAPKEPVIDRISHVVLFNTNSKTTREGGGLEIVGGSSLAGLVTSAGEITAKAGQPARANASAGRDSWAALTSGSSKGAAVASAPRSGGSSRKFASQEYKEEGPARGPSAGPAKPTQVVSGSPDEGTHYRTEFVVLFVWKEETPSDSLRGGDLPPGTTAAAVK